MPSTVIVGLGVSGLACAIELTRREHEFVAFEKGARAGGLARTEIVDRFSFDRGPHVLLGIPADLEGFFGDLSGLDLRACAGASSVVLDGRLSDAVPTPFQRNLNHLRLEQRARLSLDLLQGRMRPRRDPGDYREYVISRCGRGVYDLFLGRYESKRLRFPLSEIPADWTSRVQPPSVRSLLLPRWMTPGQAARGDARFLYPRAGGMEALPRAMAALVPGERMQCDRELVEIDVRRRSVAFDAGSSAHYDNLVLSLPLPEVVSRIVDAPLAVREAAENLVYTSVYVLGIGVEGAVRCSQFLIRFPDAGIGFYRLSFPSHYNAANAPEGCSSIVGEISHHPSRHPISVNDARDAFRSGIARLGLLGRGQPTLVETFRDIRYAHVVYNHETRASVGVITDFLNRHGIHLCGKYGTWKDLLMTHSIQTGISVARAIAGREA